MKRWGFFSDYFSFSRKERIGILMIGILMFFMILFPDISVLTGKNKIYSQDTSWFAFMRDEDGLPGDSVGFNDEEYSRFYPEKGLIKSDNDREENPIHLFLFDPNLLSDSGWSRLGINAKTRRTIRNYLEKGGHFYKPEDLQKIYGMRKKDVERLLPYVSIRRKKELLPDQQTHAGNKSQSSYTEPISVSINAADTTAFISLPGIGSKLAARIINFRNKLGGFYSPDQIGETYGLADSVFRKIRPFLKPGVSPVRKININTASVEELKTHPYIRYHLATLIVAFRDEHGLYKSLEELKKIAIIDDPVYQRISHYLTIE